MPKNKIKIQWLKTLLLLPLLDTGGSRLPGQKRDKEWEEWKKLEKEKEEERRNKERREKEQKEKERREKEQKK